MDERTSTSLQRLLNTVNGLDVVGKPMFGCYCIYCDGQPVGWLSGDVFGLKEVGLDSIPAGLSRPAPDARVHEIPISADRFEDEWLSGVLVETAARVAQRKHTPARPGAAR